MCGSSKARWGYFEEKENTTVRLKSSVNLTHKIFMVPFFLKETGEYNICYIDGVTKSINFKIITW
jgi:hypothetical protein